MKESVVLLYGVTPTCTELARHLVLAGINISLLKSDDKVTEEDPEEDFLFSKEDVG
jgi:molybdopterin/thiamine biosynthesis adenylyltransferase